MSVEHTGATLAGVRVLLAEDHVDSRELMTELLQIYGIAVFAAESGEQALELFARERPDIVVSDIAMNGMRDGIALIRRIRELPHDCGRLTPAIALSAHSNEDECILAGFHVHMRKPVNPLRLIDVLAELVRCDEDDGTTWSLETPRPGLVHVRWLGHVRASAMRAVMTIVSEMLTFDAPLELITDFRRMTGFDASVPSVGQRAVWSVRAKISRVFVVGGSPSARLATRGACAVLGIAVHVQDALPYGIVAD